MTREEKIKMLTEVFKGKKPVSEVLPSLPICLIETEPGVYIEANQRKVVPAEKVQDYLSQLKEEHPKHVIDATFIHHEEYERVSAELEAQY